MPRLTRRRLFVLLACVTGARRGELCALRWDDIDAGKQFASKFPTGKAAIHQNHGLFTVGQSVDGGRGARHSFEIRPCGAHEPGGQIS